MTPERPRELNPFVVLRETRTRAALVYGAISARAVSDQRHSARLAPGVVQIRSRWRHSYSDTASLDARRGKITAFTDRSRRRLKLRARQAEWPRGVLLFLTLTWPRHFSADPADWYRDLRAWRSSYERRWGKWVTVYTNGRARRMNVTKLVAIWAREFQRRGAPHYHIALVAPKGTTVDEFREWSARAWYRIAGRGRCQHDRNCAGHCWFSVKDEHGAPTCVHANYCQRFAEGDCRHLAQHLKPAHCKKARSAHELLGYLAKEISKRRQKELPDWLVELELGAGRWWGVWNLPRVFVDEPISRREFHIVRRVVRAIHGARERARGKPPRRWRTWMMQGISIEDRSGRQWSLAQAIYALMLFCRRPSDPRRSGYANWDERLDRGLELFADTT